MPSAPPVRCSSTPLHRFPSFHRGAFPAELDDRVLNCLEQNVLRAKQSCRSYMCSSGRRCRPPSSCLMRTSVHPCHRSTPWQFRRPCSDSPCVYARNSGCVRSAALERIKRRFSGSLSPDSASPCMPHSPGFNRVRFGREYGR